MLLTPQEQSVMLVDKRSGHTFFYKPITATDLFSGLSESGHATLTAMMQSKHFEPNQQVFAAGDSPRNIYLLDRGHADLIDDKRHQMSSTHDLVGPDQLFGITEMLSGRNFETGLRTISPCDFYIIERDDFFAFLHNQPDICYRLASMIGSLYSEALRNLKIN
ncbi:MAG TPA: cyclic nucleotide-binding domain-containing protein [Pyrinomonadaceae bacterium]|nr:cyclic nucleotide-binding domain-containing protein [Pyrinomonadaceae bacterium]